MAKISDPEETPESAIIPAGLVTEDDAQMVIEIMTYFAKATKFMQAKEENDAETALKVSEELDEMMANILEDFTPDQFGGVLTLFHNLVGSEPPILVNDHPSARMAVPDEQSG